MPAREHSRWMVPPSTTGKQPRPGPQPPSASQIWVHIGPSGAEVSHSPLRQVLLVIEQSEPAGSGPKMSAGGTQIGVPEPKASAQL